MIRLSYVRSGAWPSSRLVSANLTKTIVVLVAAGLAGCEAVAGIQDLTYEPSGDAAVGDDGAVGAHDGSTDATASADTAIGEGGSQPDATTAADSNTPPQGEGGEAGGPDALSSLDGGADAPSGDARVDAAPDSGSTPDAGTPTGSDAGDAGTTVVPEAGPPLIPGADGGPIHGIDGGVLVGDLIDNMDLEVAAGSILANSGRRGTWFTYSDGTDGGVMPLPSAGPAPIVGVITSFSGVTTNKAAHVTGNGAATYAGMGFNVNALTTAATYDASAYQGFTFWARTGSGTASVSFNVPDLNTVAMTGGVCTVCGDNFTFPPITVTTTWQQYVVYFNQLAQQGFGVPHENALDVAAIYGAQFQLGKGPAFDLWVDDVYFIVK
jgi:hypothetical protein